MAEAAKRVRTLRLPPDAAVMAFTKRRGTCEGGHAVRRPALRLGRRFKHRRRIRRSIEKSPTILATLSAVIEFRWRTGDLLMRWQGRRESENVEDRRGMDGGG